MNPQILNSPLRPESTWKPHHGRHLLSGTLAVLLTLAIPLQFEVGVSEDGVLVWRKMERKP